MPLPTHSLAALADLPELAAFPVTVIHHAHHTTVAVPHDTLFWDEAPSLGGALRSRRPGGDGRYHWTFDRGSLWFDAVELAELLLTCYGSDGERLTEALATIRIHLDNIDLPRAFEPMETPLLARERHNEPVVICDPLARLVEGSLPASGGTEAAPVIGHVDHAVIELRNVPAWEARLHGHEIVEITAGYPEWVASREHSPAA